jgi:hypothetical protein
VKAAADTVLEVGHVGIPDIEKIDLRYFNLKIMNLHAVKKP